MVNTHRQSIGRFGEAAAELHLIAAGATVLDRNWRCRIGEIDLIVQEDSWLVLVEVKSRLVSPQAEQLLFENVTRAKQRRLVGLSTIYSSVARSRGLKVSGVRIDVIGVLLEPAPLRVSKIVHLKGAIGR